MRIDCAAAQIRGFVAEWRIIMSNIFIGLIFILLDFNFNVNNSTIGLLPDFIGFLFILKGITQLTGESTWFTRLKPFALGMAVYTCIIYLFDLFGIFASLGILSLILGLTSTAISLYITYGIVMGVRDIEMFRGWKLSSLTLLSAWRLLAVCAVLIYFIIFIPMVNFMSLLAGWVINIYFLYYFNRTKNLYYTHC
jgi:hypothetical protein